jgi:hypothetical protein
VNTVRGIGKIFEFPVDIDNVLEWINLYVPVYHNVSVVNSVNNIIFEEEYSIPAKRAARETVAEKFEESKRRKKKSRIF